ncbi:MAG: restriction endonuclease subunit S [Candidatus Ancillula sp.]|nr:restriction endonuclease subunit S [Candidatus Ancillula sp.]
MPEPEFWGEFRVGDLFEIRPTRNYGLTNSELFSISGEVPVIGNKSVDNAIAGYVDLEPTESGNMIVFSDTTTSDGIFYQPNSFVGYSHMQGLYPKKHDDKLNETTYLYIVSAFRKSTEGLYNYGSKFTRKNAAEHILILPRTSTSTPEHPEPDWEFMENYVRLVEAHYVHLVEAHLTSLGYSSIEDVELTDDDLATLQEMKTAEFGEFTVGELFEFIKRGKRIKSADRVSGDLPFITAGVGNMGFSANIGNIEAEVFPKNSLTIDMFGTVFYRGYNFGADDHVAVLHDDNVNYSQQVLQFIQPNIENAIKGQFSYSRNFYASDAPEITINLPITNDQVQVQEDRLTPNFFLMSRYIKVIEKKVVKNLKLELDQRLATYNEVINNG